MFESKYGKYFLTDANTPSTGVPSADDYAKWATRLTWLDNNVIEGAFFFGCSWYFRAPDKPLPAHTHDFDEILGFYGSDPQNPRDLGGEVELWMEDEKHIITKSALLFVPAGMKHCPLILKRVDRPIFHFTIVPGGLYIKDEDSGT